MIETQYDPRMLNLPNYYKWVIDLIHPYVGKRVLNAGCGGGDAMQWCISGIDYCLAADLEEKMSRLFVINFKSKISKGLVKILRLQNLFGIKIKISIRLSLSMS